jgi:hypothetical protein
MFASVVILLFTHVIKLTLPTSGGGGLSVYSRFPYGLCFIDNSFRSLLDEKDDSEIGIGLPIHLPRRSILSEGGYLL